MSSDTHSLRAACLVGGLGLALCVTPAAAVSLVSVTTLSIFQTPTTSLFQSGDIAEAAGGSVGVSLISAGLDTSGSAVSGFGVAKSSASYRPTAAIQPLLQPSDYALGEHDFFGTTTYGISQASDDITPLRSMKGHANLFFDRTVSADYTPDTLASEAFLRDFQLATGATGGTASSSWLAASATLSFRIDELTDGGPVPIIAFQISSGAVSIENLYGDALAEDPGFMHSLDSNGVDEILTYDYRTNTTTFGPVTAFDVGAGAHNASGNYGFDYTILAGHHYRLNTYLVCTAQSYGAAAYAGAGGSVCDASHSAYWNGMTHVTDLDGNPVDFAATSDSGFDYSHASPLSPSPASDGVPEPAVWALMLLGFGAAGARLRARASRSPESRVSGAEGTAASGALPTR